MSRAELGKPGGSGGPRERAGTRRSFYGSIGFTVLILNVLLVFLPVAGFFLLDTYERQLLLGLERTLSEQARMLAAGLALAGGGAGADGAGAVGSGTAGGDLTRNAIALLASLGQRHEARIRVFGADGRLLADSAAGASAAVVPTPAAGPAASTAAEDTPLYRLASGAVRLARQALGFILGAPARQAEAADLYDRGGSFADSPEIAAALAGGYGAATRIIGMGDGRRLVLYSALPVAGTTVQGVVLVSQSTSRILAELYAMRLDIFRIFLWSVALAAALSVLLSLLIGRPLGQLARQAAGLLDERGRIAGSFTPLRAHNEIGLLSRRLEEMRQGLERYTRFLESFNDEAAHEIRNPLASVRASLELLGHGEADPARRVLFEGAQADLRRMNALLLAVGDLGRADTEPLAPDGVAADAGRVLAEAAAGFRLRHPEMILEFAGAAEGPVLAGVDPLRLRQAADNMLENAASFSAPGGRVELRHGVGEGGWVCELRDWGPGFPPGDEERLFDRFYSSRKQDGVHTGLGLALVKSLVERWGGRVRAENAGPGARFRVEVPLPPASGRA
jgi:two-component system sensor histidine kinase ChvG